jgi:outer membrane receptor protein involved in Fe transport
MKTHSKKFLAAVLATTTTLAFTAPTFAQDVEEIVVTGSHIKKKSQFDSSSPIATIDQTQVDTTGFTTSSEVIRWMPYNTGSENQANALTQGGTPGTSNINLRGLGLGSTLVLINGRRQTVSSAVANRGDTFVDINAMMPMIMVQRLETLKDGASAVYGSDAVAGVVNFFTRDGFEGMELRYDRSQTTRSDDHSDSTISGIWGAGNDQSHVVVAASYLHREGMFTTDRNFPYATLSSFGNPGSFLPLGLPLIGVPGVFNADPDCGAYSDTSIYVPTGGGSSLCYYDFGPNYSLIPDETRAQVYATASHDVSEYLNFYAEFGLSRNTGTAGFSASFPNLAFPVVPAAHPANPYGVPVLWRGRAIGDGNGDNGENRVLNTWDDITTRFVFGLQGDIPGTQTWSYDLSHSYSENVRSGTAYDQVGSKMYDALNGVGGPDCPFGAAPGDPGCFWFNPFGSSISASPGDPEYNDPELMNYITAHNFGQTETALWTVDATITGDMFELPAGMLQAAFGYQHRNESRNSLESDDARAEDLVFLVGGQDTKGKRKIDAVFAEFYVPLMNNDSGTLDLDLAVRYTDYDGQWNSTDPKVGILFRPQDNMSFRASYSTSFRAPTLYQVSNDGTSLNAVVDGITASLAFLATTAGANPGLQPEEADTFSVGFSYAPQWAWLEGLSIDVDYYKVKYENLLTREAAQDIANAQAAAWAANLCPAPPVVALPAGPCFDIASDPKVVRAFDTGTGSGALTPFRIYVDRYNAAKSETDGFDFNVTYARDWGIIPGDVVIKNETTYVNSFEFQADASSPVLEGAGNRNIDTPIARSIPQWRSNTYIGWALGRHEANVIVRYIDSYNDGRTTGTIEKIDSWTTFDVQYSYDLTDHLNFHGDTRMTLGLNNVTDEDPPFVSSNVSGGNDFGYDVKVHDPRGRMLYFRIVQGF